MIVSDSHRFICFQPWKCSSTTLTSRLKKYDSGRFPVNRHFNKTLGKKIQKHIALDDFVQLPENSKKFFRFVFVRNPYDRIYSGFLQRKDRLTNDKCFFRKNPKFEVELESINRGFSHFLEYQAKCYAQDGSIVGRFLHEYICHEGQNVIDFIGYTETFEASFAQVCDILGIDVEETPEKNANVRFDAGKPLSSETFSKSRYRYIKEFDSKSVRLVNEIYQKDFEVLEYKRLDPDTFNPTTDICPFSID